MVEIRLCIFLFPPLLSCIRLSNIPECCLAQRTSKQINRNRSMKTEQMFEPRVLVLVRKSNSSTKQQQQQHALCLALPLPREMLILELWPFFFTVGVLLLVVQGRYHSLVEVVWRLGISQPP